MEKQWHELVKKIRQPKMMLILVFLLGILFNGSFYLYRILPQFVPMQNLAAQFDQLESQRIALEKTSIPPKISTSEIEGIVQQVPISDNSARFLTELIEIESQSGVEIESISDRSGTTNNDLTELLTSDAANSAASFAEQTMEVSILGTYAKLIDFINRVAGLPRFVNSKEWVFSDGSAVVAAGQNIDPLLLSPEAVGIQVKQRIKIKFTIYSAYQYKNMFPDLSPLSITEDPEKRLNPTIPDTRYYKLLDSLNN
jgi:Tfp pilus assembly protein PilO